MENDFSYSEEQSSAIFEALKLANKNSILLSECRVLVFWAGRKYVSDCLFTSWQPDNEHTSKLVQKKIDAVKIARDELILNQRDLALMKNIDIERTKSEESWQSFERATTTLFLKDEISDLTLRGLFAYKEMSFAIERLNCELNSNEGNEKLFRNNLISELMRIWESLGGQIQSNEDSDFMKFIVSSVNPAMTAARGDSKGQSEHNFKRLILEINKIGQSS